MLVCTTLVFIVGVNENDGSNLGLTAASDEGSCKLYAIFKGYIAATVIMLYTDVG